MIRHKSKELTLQLPTFVRINTMMGLCSHGFAFWFSLIGKIPFTSCVWKLPFVKCVKRKKRDLIHSLFQGYFQSMEMKDLPLNHVPSEICPTFHVDLNCWLERWLTSRVSRKCLSSMKHQYPKGKVEEKFQWNFVNVINNFYR